MQTTRHGAPIILLKNVPSWAKMSVFQQYYWGSIMSGLNGTFSSGSPRPNAALELDEAIFQNLSAGPSYVAICTRRRRPKRPKIVGKGCVEKRGSILTFPPKYLLYLDVEFDGDFIFLSKMI